MNRRNMSFAVLSGATIVLIGLVHSAQVSAEATAVEEILVVAEQDRRTFVLAETVDITPDSAVLLRKAVGANVLSNGPITGIAQYRGMSRYRVSSHIDGAVISPGGPNWMDPPLSYAPAAHLESLEVYRGIAPVSAGQETIGGMSNANTWSGDFGGEEFGVKGRVRSGVQSANAATLLSGAVVLADKTHRIKLSGLSEQADDMEFADGEVLPSEYERQRYDLGYSFQVGNHTLRLDFGRNETGDAGTAALPMDIEYIDSNLYRLGYVYDSDAWSLDARIYQSDIEHGMTNYHLRTAPADLGRYRRNVADADNFGFAVELSTARWSFGVDGHRERHDSDITNPNAPMFFVTNFNDAERQVFGAYIERRLRLGGGKLLELGARYNRVSMDADVVDATPARVGMPPAVNLRERFNNADRSKHDDNVDLVAKLYVPAGAQTTLYAGVARKSRAPSYQERYLWLPLQATAGLADGRTYIGDISLDSEVAHEIELGMDWHSRNLSVSPRMFYRDVNDYIQGTPQGNSPAAQFVMMMNRANGTSNAAPLSFSNVDAKFYGLDVDWRWSIDERWSVEGVLNLLRGERQDVDDDLYRVAPHNLFLSLNYTQPGWGMSAESFAYNGQSHVSSTNSEQESSGYALLNVKGYWVINQQLKLGFGIDNLTDRDYGDHLAGINRVGGNPDLQQGERLPGIGRNFFLRLDLHW
ncbi:MAG: TonB-dependent receptor plug domain-containing protein [Pseudomonadales bacterium]